MTTAYGIVTGVLVVAVLAAAIPKLRLTVGARQQFRRLGVGDPVIRLAGATETAAAVGLVAGFWLPWLGVAAAAGLAVQLLLAVGWHLRAKDEAPRVILPLVLLALTAVALVLRLETMP